MTWELAAAAIAPYYANQALGEIAQPSDVVIQSLLNQLQDKDAWTCLSICVRQ